jgi:hypothetical protein
MGDIEEKWRKFGIPVASLDRGKLRASKVYGRRSPAAQSVMRIILGLHLVHLCNEGFGSSLECFQRRSSLLRCARSDLVNYPHGPCVALVRHLVITLLVDRSPAGYRYGDIDRNLEI